LTEWKISGIVERTKKERPAGAGRSLRAYALVMTRKTQKSRRTWFSHATAVARRQVPANFPDFSGHLVVENTQARISYNQQEFTRAEKIVKGKI